GRRPERGGRERLLPRRRRPAFRRPALDRKRPGAALVPPHEEAGRRAAAPGPGPAGAGGGGARADPPGPAAWAGGPGRGAREGRVVRAVARVAEPCCAVEARFRPGQAGEPLPGAPADAGAAGSLAGADVLPREAAGVRVARRDAEPASLQWEAARRGVA